MTPIQAIRNGIEKTQTFRIVLGLILALVAFLISIPLLLVECWIWFISYGYVSSATSGTDFLFTPNNNALLFWSGPMLFFLALIVYPFRKSKIIIVFLGLVPIAQALFNFYFVYLEQAI